MSSVRLLADSRRMSHSDLLGPLTAVFLTTTAPITTADAKAFLRVDNDDEDELIEELQLVALEYCESQTQRQFRPATYDLKLRGWWDGALTLPRPPTASVASITYADSAGTTQTVSTSVYEVVPSYRGVGQIVRAPHQVWPVVQSGKEYPITIRFSCGYGAGSIPKKSLQAIRMAMAWFYDHREPSEIELKAVNALLSSEAWGL